MPNVNDLKTSRFLTKNDVEAPVLVTIKSWEKMNVAQGNQKEDIKYCLVFRELEKPLVLNKTNGLRIADIAGSEDFDKWPGTQIVLFNDPNVEFGGKLTGGIRIRASKGGNANSEYVGDGQEGICPHCQKPLEDCTCNIPF